MGCTKVIYPQPGSIFLLVILVKVYFVSPGFKPKSTFTLRHPEDLTFSIISILYFRAVAHHYILILHFYLVKTPKYPGDQCAVYYYYLENSDVTT